LLQNERGQLVRWLAEKFMGWEYHEHDVPQYWDVEFWWVDKGSVPTLNNGCGSTIGRCGTKVIPVGEWNPLGNMNHAWMVLRSIEEKELRDLIYLHLSHGSRHDWLFGLTAAKICSTIAEFFEYQGDLPDDLVCSKNGQ